MVKDSTLPHLHYMYAFFPSHSFPSVFVHIYQKNFLQISTMCKSDTTQKWIFDVICHVIFHIFWQS